jgi:two-component sensor histidine kinase
LAYNFLRHKGRLEIERDKPFNAAVLHIHHELVRRRYLLLSLALVVYAAIVLSLGTVLEVSSNYFIIIPLLAAAFGFGLPGGIIMGALGLPSNLLLFAILGHPEYSPASKIIAEFSGVTLGLALGLLAEYFGEIGREIRRRANVESSLRDALEEKELLLRELQHRVKNNLNVIQSLVMLQKSRSNDPVFIDASDELIARIFAMAHVHDRLFGVTGSGSIDLKDYLEGLTRDIAYSLGIDETRITRTILTRGESVSSDTAMPLGLIVNEVFMNIVKHARIGPDSSPRITVSLELDRGEYTLRIEDDGPGLQDSSSSGLGMKLVTSLAANIGAYSSFAAISSETGMIGSRFELRWREAPKVK